MAYVKNTWATGDVVTAAKLNNMENGIEAAAVLPSVSVANAGEVLGVTSGGNWNNITLMKVVAIQSGTPNFINLTYAAASNLLDNGKLVVLLDTLDPNYKKMEVINSWGYDENDGYFIANNNVYFTAATTTETLKDTGGE